MKEKKFHGEYYSPGQGKRPDQYEKSAKYIAISMIVLFVAAVIASILNITMNL